MDSNIENYAKRLIEAIGAADVISIFFFRVGQSFILDLRAGEESTGFVTLDAMVESPYQRLLSFGTLRPSLPLPEEITLAPWPDRVRTFEETGVMAAFLERCRESGGEPLVEEAQRCYERLLQFERQALRNMIRGIGMETLWERGANQDG
jgi:hypothetical protein